MIDDAQLGVIEQNIRDGRSLDDSLLAAGVQPSLQVKIWLKENHYQRLTDAKKGEGHAEAQAELRKQLQGSG